MPKTPQGEESLRLFVARAVFSGVVLLAALVVILSGRFEPETHKWATGAIGFILGYWLK